MKRDANDVLRDHGPDVLRQMIDGSHNGAAAPGKAGALTAKPFTWPDPATIPPRQFLFGKHYARRNIGASIGSGGRAKTTRGLTDAISMACGRDLLTGEDTAPLRVWFLNGEEDQDELDRRVTAICQHYGVTEEQCGGRLFVQSVRDRPIRLATMAGNVPTLNRGAIDQLEAEIRANLFDVFMLDPLISFHSVSENINEHMDLLFKEGLGGIASRTNSAGEVFHHPAKMKPGQAETTVEDARGASAIIFAVRSARVFNFMAPEEAARFGISEEDRRLYIRLANGKANMDRTGKVSWFKLEPEILTNGDEIACASPWQPPNPFKGVTTADMLHCRTLTQTGAFRLDARASNWIGYMVADVLKISVAQGADNDPKDIARIKQILKTWLKNKVLVTEERPDENRKMRTFVIPGPWSEPKTAAADEIPDPDEL